MVIISGGGTGGHIFPAVAIAQELGALRPDLEFLFVGAKGKMEMEKVPKAGYRIIGLPITAFHRRLTVKNLLFPFRLILSLFIAQRIIAKYRPAVVVGTGGFASGPLMKAAARKGIPIVIQEQNAFPGVTNRLMASKAKKICVAHEGLEKWFPSEKIHLTGNPVRKDLTNIGSKKNDGYKLFGLSREKPVVLLFGGSLGALTMNQAVNSRIEDLKGLGIQMIWQTGPSYISVAKERIKEAGATNIQAHAFLEKMDLAYAASDIVICRAGAITLSELAIAAKPCVLIPYPAAAGNHQMKNALAYKEKGAGKIVENQNAVNELVEVLEQLLGNEELRKGISESLASLARPAAGIEIANEIIKIIDQK